MMSNFLELPHARASDKSGDGGETVQNQESKDVVKAVNDIRGKAKCRSVVVFAKNVAGILWIDKGSIENSQFFWYATSKARLSALTLGLDLNIRKIESDLPTVADYKYDALTASRKFKSAMETEVSEVKKSGKLDCRLGTKQ